jgi:hypothetical protein
MSIAVLFGISLLIVGSLAASRRYGARA